MARRQFDSAAHHPTEVQIDKALSGAATVDGDKRDLTSLRRATELLEERVESLEEQLEEAQQARGVLHFVKASASGIGLSYVYFIGFLTLWDGPPNKVAETVVVRA